MKTCIKCKKAKDLSEYHKKSEAKSGFVSTCKSCKKEFDLLTKEKRKDKMDEIKHFDFY